MTCLWLYVHYALTVFFSLAWLLPSTDRRWLTYTHTPPNPPPQQEGAQTIIGFNFKASLTMDMEEVLPEGESPDDRMLQQRRIRFTLVDSAMFADFSGEWRLQCYSRMSTGCADGDWTYSTKLFYMVNVKCVQPHAACSMNQSSSSVGCIHPSFQPPHTPQHQHQHTNTGPRAWSPWARWSGASARTCPRISAP